MIAGDAEDSFAYVKVIRSRPREFLALRDCR
jgi:hypothetical protein